VIIVVLLQGLTGAGPVCQFSRPTSQGQRWGGCQDTQRENEGRTTQAAGEGDYIHRYSL